MVDSCQGREEKEACMVDSCQAGRKRKPAWLMAVRQGGKGSVHG